MFYLCGSRKPTVYSQNPFNKRWRRELDRRVRKKGHLDIFNRRRVVGQGHRKSGQLCLVPVLVRSGRQTTDSVFSKIPDSGQNRDRQNADRKTSDRKSGQQTDTGHDFPEIPDKNETRTGHGQYCPPTSAIQSFILDFLWEPSYIFFWKFGFWARLLIGSTC